MGHPSLDLTGKVAVVLGGTAGIGRAFSLGMAEAGADVVACARTAETVEATAKEIEARGRRTVRATADVTDRASLEKARDAVLGAFGKIDILVNCAGRIKRTPVLDLSEEEWGGILETNLTGTLRACQVFGRPMIEKGYGRIVNVASLNSFVSFLEVAAYAASKAGVSGLTRSLAVEWGPKGVDRQRHRPRRLPHRARTRSSSTGPSAARSCACARRSSASARSRSWWACASSSPPTRRASSTAR